MEKKHILIIIENLPAPFDKRVWQEATSLKKAGFDISIICPKMKGYNNKYEKIDGIEIYRHPLPVEANGALEYLFEYSISLFWELFLSFKIFFKKRFHIIHGCNPPDLLFLVALPFKLFGVKYVFDHHDPNPELFLSKFQKKGIPYQALLLMERCNFFVSNRSIATNESFKKLAVTRGKMKEKNVFVVRSGPNLNRFKIMPPNKEYKKGKAFLVGYLGIIGDQDGLDELMRIIKDITNVRQDIHFAIIGDGTALPDVKKLAQTLQISDYVDFYGIVTDDQLISGILSTCDVCVNPDLPTEMNMLCTTNKVMEYMAMKKPIVQFDLPEGRFSSQEASLYATDTKDFAKKIVDLLNNEETRKKMGELGYQRVVNKLSWNHEEKKLITFYNQFFN